MMREISSQMSVEDAIKSSEEWKLTTKQETFIGMKQELQNLRQSVPSIVQKEVNENLNGFQKLFMRFLKERSFIDWNLIEPLPDESVIPYNRLLIENVDTALVAKQLNQLIVVKLNGGLGTSMGCKGPKSAVPVRNDLTFLDLTMQQILQLNVTYGVNIPLVLMNSFNTDEDTKKLLRKYSTVQVNVHSFCQSKYPRIFRESLMPVVKDVTNGYSEDWYPPGHGNFYESFYNLGILDKFIQQGKKYCFVSNIDNMGATVDLNILNYILQQPNDNKDLEFIMEITDKTRADIKGGTLIQYCGRLRLLEIAQVPNDYVDEFKSVSKFRFFNTNNLWAKLDAIKRVVENDELNLEIIVNPKHLDRGIDVIQLETAAGAAIKNFKGARGVIVPRSRFLPVKKTSDLLLLMSNLYDINNGSLTLSELRSFPTTPFVKLGSSFDKVTEFRKRFRGIPDLLELDHLTVSGDVWFGHDVTLKVGLPQKSLDTGKTGAGTVIIIANHGERIDIARGTILENKIVSGNLIILDH